MLTGRTAPHQRFTATAVRGLLIGLGLCSLFGMPTQSALVLLWFMLLVAWLTVAIANPDVPLFHKHGVVICTAAALLSVAYAATHVVLARGSLSVPARAAMMHRPLVTGAYGPEEGPDGQFTWTREEANFYWPVAGQFIVLRLAAPQPDHGNAPVQLTITTPCFNVLDLPVTSPDAITVGLQVPQGQPMLHGQSRCRGPSAHRISVVRTGGTRSHRLGRIHRQRRAVPRSAARGHACRYLERRPPQCRFKHY